VQGELFESVSSGWREFLKQLLWLDESRCGLEAVLTSVDGEVSLQEVARRVGFTHCAVYIRKGRHALLLSNESILPSPAAFTLPKPNQFLATSVSLLLQN
jgi:hypothetical protein